jgi:hypothetical protein
MNKASYPLKLPVSVKETAADFLKRRAGEAKPSDMLPFLDGAKREPPPPGDEC